MELSTNNFNKTNFPQQSHTEQALEAVYKAAGLTL